MLFTSFDIMLRVFQRKRFLELCVSASTNINLQKQLSLLSPRSKVAFGRAAGFFDQESGKIRSRV